jgi:hypothetical protein
MVYRSGTGNFFIARHRCAIIIITSYWRIFYNLDLPANYHLLDSIRSGKQQGVCNEDELVCVHNSWRCLSLSSLLTTYVQRLFIERDVVVFWA